MTDFATFMPTISPSSMQDSDKTATRLLVQFGFEKALKQARRELGAARRARSRKRYSYWQTVAEAISLNASILE